MKPKTLTPGEALDRATSGGVVLVDIREPPEWQATGVPVPARTVALQGPDLLGRLAAAGVEPETPVALICASGRRSAWLQGELERAGFAEVYDVAEGMKGGDHGLGWLRRGLPVRQSS